MTTRPSACGLILLFWIATAVPADDDLLVADFEQETYGSWQTTGTAFGPGPAQGTLSGQMQVDGFQGLRLVNSFYEGDGTTGTLTSPPFTIERRHLAFLIGGGGFADKTCVNLLLGDQVVRTATGPHVDPGGSERLQPAVWNVEDLIGKQVRIQVVDDATGGWGHINVDHIVQTNNPPKVIQLGKQQKSFVVDQTYLVIPIKNGVPKTEITVEVEGSIVRRYETELATDPHDVDWYAFFHLDTYRGKKATVNVARGSDETFALLRPAEKVPGQESWYSEPLRPQFHFSQTVGWNNDPNGMVYHEGKWHLFFQHNPVGWNWGNMTWGHAISEDLVHWKQLPDALFPSVTTRGACFSGGGTTDPKNTAGWQTGDRDVLVVFLTDTGEGAGESVAYSNDGGTTFQWYKGNPVVKHRGRDPKVIWYEYDEQDEPLNEAARRLGGHWVMAVYDEHDDFGRNIAFYTSLNLKDWQEQSHVSGFYECPELFELATEGNEEHRQWVIFAADAQYVLGDFDGRRFTPAHEGKHRVHWGAYYASQTFENSPDGRRIQIGWVQVPAPGMPFNQTFSFPHELTLRRTADGIRMFARPLPEIEKLHRAHHTASKTSLSDASSTALSVAGELFDIRATLSTQDAKTVGIDVGGNRIEYDVNSQKLGEAPMAAVDGKITLQILVDRNMIEICGNDGRVFVTLERKSHGPVNAIKAYASGGQATLEALDVFELNSIWSSTP